MLASLFRSERAIQATPWGEWAGDYAPTYSGAKVDSLSAMQLATVYGCVRIISDGIATLPVDVLRDTGGAVKETLTLPTWLEYPVIGLHRVAWLTQILSSLLLDGNAYIAVTRDDQMRIVELIPLDAKTVDVQREKGVRTFYVNGNPKQGILHIPALMLAGSEVGFSPVEAARQTVGNAMAVQEYAGQFFRQGTTLSGVIEDPAPADANKARDTARIFGRLHSGVKKAHLPAVLMGGMTWKQTGVTNEQAQFLETQGFNAAEIAGRMFLLDPSDLGIPVAGTSLTYANLEQRNARRVQVAFLPWIVRVEMALSSLLAKPRYVKFNLGGLLRGDMLTRFQAYDIGIRSKFMLPNEAREYEDWAPLPGGGQVEDIPQTGGAPNAAA